MGALHRFDLQPWVDKYKLVNYVETGFGDLTSFKHALNYSFEKFFGVDLDKDWVDKAQFLSKENVTFINGYSTDSLLVWSTFLLENTLWFLDSHFPFSDYKNLTYDESISQYKKQSLPLEDELNIILNNRDVSKDVFVIDDFFLYAGDHLTEFSRNNPFQYRELAKELGIDLSSKFIYDFFKDTHNLEVDTKDQGYLIITPKS